MPKTNPIPNNHESSSKSEKPNTKTPTSDRNTIGMIGNTSTSAPSSISKRKQPEASSSDTNDTQEYTVDKMGLIKSDDTLEYAMNTKMELIESGYIDPNDKSSYLNDTEQLENKSNDLSPTSTHSKA